MLEKFINKIHNGRAKATCEKWKRAGAATSFGVLESTSTFQKHNRDHHFDKYKRIVSQEITERQLHYVSTKNMGAQLWKIGQETNGGSLIARRSSDHFLHGVAEISFTMFS